MATGSTVQNPVWFDRDVRRAEVGWDVQDQEEGEANWPAETVMDRLYEAWRTR